MRPRLRRDRGIFRPTMYKGREHPTNIKLDYDSAALLMSDFKSDMAFIQATTTCGCWCQSLSRWKWKSKWRYLAVSDAEGRGVQENDLSCTPIGSLIPYKPLPPTRIALESIPRSWEYNTALSSMTVRKAAFQTSWVSSLAKAIPVRRPSLSPPCLIQTQF